MNENIPEFRFNNFTSTPKKYGLSEIVERVKSYSLSRDVETKEDTGYKYIHYGDIHKKVANIIDQRSQLPNIKTGDYELLKKGDIVIADASEDYQGIATPSMINVETSYKIVAGLHTIALRPIKVDSLFIYYLFNSQTFRKYGYKVGTGMKVFGISVSNVMKFESFFPNTNEQSKIGVFFKQLDETIILQQQLLNDHQQLKKAMLQKMFPQKGEAVPKVRFADFSDEWKEYKSKDIFCSISDKNHPDLPVLSASQQKGMIYRSDINIDIQYNKESTKTYKRVIPGQFVIHLRSFQGGFAYSNIEGITSPAYTVIDFKCKDSQKAMFWKHILTSNNFIKILETITYGIRDGRSISFSEFSTLKFRVPSYNEQDKISTFFDRLDSLIASNQKKLETYQELKKAMLQKMFV